MTLLFIFVFFYFLGFVFSPFPYWPVYFKLWKHLLFDGSKQIGLNSRLIQIRFLLINFFQTPIWTLLWFLDEIFFSSYKRFKVRPVFILGQPRCGTTLLHRTLASDTKNFFAIRHFEWRYPFIIVQKMVEWFNLKDWIQNKNYWPDTEVGRKAAHMHPNSLYDWEEDGIFFEERFLYHFFIFLRFPYPKLLPYLDAYPLLSEQVQKHFLSVHQKVIQKIMYMRGDEHLLYLSKEVTSHSKFKRLISLYPDAQFVVSVRPSSEFMSSLLELVLRSTQSKTGLDAMTIPDWEASFMERMREDTLILVDLSRNIIQKDRQILLTFCELNINITREIYRIYDHLRLTVGSGQLQYLQSLAKKQISRNRCYDYQIQSFEGFDIYDQFVNEVQMMYHEANRDLKAG
ncbi:MAG: sulfotransferase [Magnetococcus sp. DMHC-6]